MKSSNFLGLAFDQQETRDWVSLLVGWGGRRFGYIVTPNVDNVISYHESDFMKSFYDRAAYRICDSRILSRLASIQGLELPALPGSDLVRALLHAPEARSLTIAVVGPSAESFARLAKDFTSLRLVHVPAAMGLVHGTDSWADLIDRLNATCFDLLICGLGYPKQEYLCHDLVEAGHQHGVAICAGASIDFLTGEQKRAPLAFQRFGIEWLHRLMFNPRRMWKRYLLKGPKIFLIFMKFRQKSTN